MNWLALMIAASLPAATPPARSQPIAIHPGESITLEMRDDAAVVVERGPAPPISAFESGMLKRLQAQQVPAGSGVQPAIAMSRSQLDAEPPIPAANRVRLTFRRVPAVRPGAEDHSFLLVVNGFAASFRYRTTMHVRDNVAPTDVCEVPPQISGSEHWPYVIDQLDLTAVWLEPFQPDNVRCE